MEEKNKKNNLGMVQWVQVIVYVVLGILLIIWPDQSKSIIFTILGCGLCIWGIIKVIVYFKEDVETGMLTQSFSLGTGLIVLGIVIMIFAVKIGEVMPIIFACMLLFGALYKTQMAFDLKKLKSAGWFTPVFGSLISLILSLLIFINLFNSESVLIIFIGVSLLIEAILNMASVIYLDKKLKNFTKLNAGE